MVSGLSVGALAGAKGGSKVGAVRTGGQSSSKVSSWNSFPSLELAHSCCADIRLGKWVMFGRWERTGGQKLKQRSPVQEFLMLQHFSK